MRVVLRCDGRNEKFPMKHGRPLDLAAALHVEAALGKRATTLAGN